MWVRFVHAKVNSGHVSKIFEEENLNPQVILMDYSITNVGVFGLEDQQIETQQQWPVQTDLVLTMMN